MNDLDAKRRLWELLSPSEAASTRLGHWIGRACQGGEIILLEGPLGSGKTHLTQGIAQGLEIAEIPVSPTFILMRSYAGARGLTLHHLDLYRLGGNEDLQTLGLEDCLSEDAVLVVEWPSRCPGEFALFSLLLEISIVSETSRQIVASGDSLILPPGLERPPLLTE